jgi:hypothetical protein
MKYFYLSNMLILLAACGGGRTPQHINDVQAQEQEQERYIYGGDAFVREHTY